MELISLLVAIASLLVAIFSFWGWRTLKPRLQEISALATEALNEVRQRIDQLDKAIISEQIAHNNTPQILSSHILELRNVLERRIRRIILFTKDKNLVYSSLLWFEENKTSEDRPYIDRAVQYKCMYGRKNRRLGKRILKDIDKQTGSLGTS